MIPEDLRYTTDHEWVRSEGETVRVGVTDYAQEALGDIVFVTLPEAGTQVTAGDTCGEVESTKSVSDLYAPLSGTVTARTIAYQGNALTMDLQPDPDPGLAARIDAALKAARIAGSVTRSGDGAVRITASNA